MCGITAVYSFNGPTSQYAIDQFTDALTHRGPDGRGTYINAGAALGHRRLSILDLSDAGACPMTYKCPVGRQFVITYNGEVYNFIELKNELESKGYRFNSRTDTEVVVAAYAEWGEDVQYRLNGMWAFVIYEQHSREMFISRDRFGIKPCYLHLQDGRIAIASELKAFRALEGAKLSFNNGIVPELLERCRYDGHAPNTACNEVFNLLGGHCARVTPAGKVDIRRWWNTSDHIPTIPQNYVQQVDEYKNLFIDSVRIRMRSDVPLATCLSGGIDSTAVSSTMRYVADSPGAKPRISSDWHNTFVATFPGSFIDERDKAELVVKHIGARPHYLDASVQPNLADLLASVVCLDEPGGGVVLPVWQLYRMLRRCNTKVSIDGHGSDELLGGYSWYLDTPLQDLSRVLYSDFHLALLPTILRNYDRCSMAHGIEVRMPFMDYRLVTFTCGLAPYSRVGGGYTKRILRDAMAGIMPEKIRRRHGKIGFNAPLINWYNNELAGFLINIVNHDFFMDHDPQSRDRLRKQALEKTLGRSWVKADWSEAFHLTIHMNLILWRLFFIEGETDFSRLFDSQPSAHQASKGKVFQEKPAQETNVALSFRAAGTALEHWQIKILHDIAKAQLELPLECEVVYYGIAQEEWLPVAVLKNIVSDESAASSTSGSFRVSLVLGESFKVCDHADMVLAPPAVRPVAGFKGIWKTFRDSDEIIATLSGLVEENSDIPIRAQFSQLSQVRAR